MNDRKSYLENLLVGLQSNGGWPGTIRSRAGLKIADRNVCFDANVLAMLDRCRLENEELIEKVALAKANLESYFTDGKVWFWPLRNGKPSYFGSKSFAKMAQIDADADCGALYAAAGGKGRLEPPRVFDHELDLVEAQKKIGAPWEGSFAVWMSKPVPGRWSQDVFDIVVDANILWQCGEIVGDEPGGIAETVGLIEWVVRSELIIEKPFFVSPYYPYPLVILYHLARMLAWGNVHRLAQLKERILELTRRCTSNSRQERLVVAAIGAFLDDAGMAGKFDFSLKDSGKPFPWFMGHLAGLSRLPGSFTLASRGFLTGAFESKAWESALELWLINRLEALEPR